MKRQKKHFLTTRKIILGVIAIASVAVVLAAVFALLSKPEKNVESKIEALASDYYENYLYQSILDSPRFSGNIEETLGKYVDTGLSIVTLRELLLHDIEKTANTKSYIEKYCDSGRTTVKYYPEAPFSKTSYRTEYSYSCEFQ